ncbi:hypothetical protein GCM10009665_11990 [Kitasatospora nipponensis]|uniref:Integral membrane protein n=1 Tax=Kitasatospora nipponensis TaxID=258049 RepID=A0ABP4GHM7_9ACTN
MGNGTAAPGGPERPRDPGDFAGSHAPGATPARPGRRMASALAAVLIVLACLLAPLSVVAVWARSQISDTDRYLATVAPLAGNPAVQAAVADRATTAITKKLPGSLLNDLAPDEQSLLGGLLGQLGGALSDELAGFVRGQVEQVMQSDAFAAAWTEVNRSAHDAFEKALNGEKSGAVQIQGDTVTLDLAPLIELVKSRLLADGLSIASSIPTVHTDYVLISSANVSRVQTAFRLLQQGGIWLPVLTLLLAAAGVLLAVRRRRALVATALGIAAAAAALSIALLIFRTIYLHRLSSDVDRAAAGAIFDTLVRFLRGGIRVLIVLGLLVGLGAWVTGDGRRARVVRGRWQAGLGSVRRRWGLRLGAVGRFTHRFKAWLGWGAVAVTVAAFLVWNYPTALVVLWLALGLLAVLAAVELLDDPGWQPHADSGGGSGGSRGGPGGAGQPPSTGTMPLR